jgi:hypothetical protein
MKLYPRICWVGWFGNFGGGSPLLSPAIFLKNEGDGWDFVFFNLNFMVDRKQHEPGAKVINYVTVVCYGHKLDNVRDLELGVHLCQSINHFKLDNTK